MPNSLVVEGIAQTGGLLVCEHGRFREKVVLAKLPKAKFHFLAKPGDSLVYTATAVASPLTAAATAVTGVVTDVRTLL